MNLGVNPDYFASLSTLIELVIYLDRLLSFFECIYYIRFEIFRFAVYLDIFERVDHLFR